MRQIRMCKDLKHLIYYRFNTVSTVLHRCNPSIEHRAGFSRCFQAWMWSWYVFVIRAQLGRVQVAASGLQDGECGSSSWGASLLYWRDGLATCWPGSLKVNKMYLRSCCISLFNNTCITMDFVGEHKNVLNQRHRFLQVDTPRVSQRLWLNSVWSLTLTWSWEQLWCMTSWTWCLRESNRTRPGPFCSISVNRGGAGRPTFPGRYIFSSLCIACRNCLGSCLFYRSPNE